MLDTTYSPYWLVLFVLLGIGYAFLLYSKKKSPWKPIWNKVLFVLRTLAITLIAYLLLEPFINIRDTKSENSQIIFLWDNSESVQKSESNLQQYFQQVKKIKESLEEKKTVSVPIFDLAGNLLSNNDSLKNDKKDSPLNEAIKRITEKVEKNRIAEVILFSDGIYNKGIAPDYYSFPFQLSTVGLGDTSKKRDVVLQQIRYNKVSYEGNQFPIEADLLQNGFTGKNATVKLSKDGQKIDQKTVKFRSEDELYTVQFLVAANTTGFQDYEISVEPFLEEYNPDNNLKNAYVNVVEGKKSILLLAPYPHPDIKALAASFSQNDNYDFEMAISGISDEPIQNLEEFDLVILFHLPSRDNIFTAEINQLKNAGTPFWFITGSNMDLRVHNELNESVDLRPSSEKDQAFAYFNSKFDLFELNAEKQEIQADLPPVYMPFVEHQFHPLSKALMMKQVGKVKTQQPVFVFYTDDDIRQATLLVQDFRIWRMVEFLNTQSFDFFDDWVMKTVRYLTANNQKDRFKAFPTRDAFADNESVRFQVELYNEVFDRVYGVPVNLRLRTETDSVINYQFTPDRLKPNFELGNLPGGIYQYTAKVVVEGNSFEAKGQFAVEEFDIENQNLQADFNLMRRLAKKNQGSFYKSDALEQLEADLMSKGYPKILIEESEVVPITQNYLPYLLILLLLFSEWFIRRYFGSY